MRNLTNFTILCLLLLASTANAQIPVANQRIVTYVASVIGTKVDRGECWDLAHDALDLVGAQWDHQYVYGKEMNPEKDSIYAGDIIHFSNVIIKSVKDGITTTQSYPQHTAIIYEVIAPGAYRIAHQNNGFSGKKVGISTLILKDKKGGKLRIYRPVVSP
jgi:hypothetical protein